MPKVKITVEERKVHVNEIIVEQPEDMSNEEIKKIIKEVERKCEDTEGIAWTLEEYYGLSIISVDVNNDPYDVLSYESQPVKRWEMRPEKKNDHLMDALRYMIARLPDDPELLKTEAYEPPKSYSMYRNYDTIEYDDEFYDDKELDFLSFY